MHRLPDMTTYCDGGGDGDGGMGKNFLVFDLKMVNFGAF